MYSGTSNHRTIAIYWNPPPTFDVASHFSFYDKLDLVFIVFCWLIPIDRIFLFQKSSVKECSAIWPFPLTSGTPVPGCSTRPRSSCCTVPRRGRGGRSPWTASPPSSLPSPTHPSPALRYRYKKCRICKLSVLRYRTVITKFGSGSTAPEPWNGDVFF